MLQMVGKPSGRIVSQTDLENIVTLRAQMRRLKRNLNMIKETAVQNLMAGAEVEDGRRTVELRTRFKGGKKIVWIQVS